MKKKLVFLFFFFVIYCIAAAIAGEYRVMVTRVNEGTVRFKASRNAEAPPPGRLLEVFRGFERIGEVEVERTGADGFGSARILPGSGEIQPGDTLKLPPPPSPPPQATALSLENPYRPTFISTEREVAIGRAAAGKFEGQYGLWSDPEAMTRVERLARQIVAVCGRTDITYHFNIANSMEFNACAFPGGFIYVNRGLLEELNDGELAFILGHELGHVVLRHSVKQIESNVFTEGLLTIVAAIFSKGKLSEGTSNTVAAVNLVVQSGYSRDDERDADLAGLLYMNKADINPAWGVSALRKMKKKSGTCRARLCPAPPTTAFVSPPAGFTSRRTVT